MNQLENGMTPMTRYAERSGWTFLVTLTWVFIILFGWTLLWATMSPDLLILAFPTGLANLATINKISSILNYRRAIINAKSK